MSIVQLFTKGAKCLTMALVLFLMNCTMAFAQNKVTGTVIDDMGDPIMGASVVQKGTTNGCTTDVDGNFSLSAPKGSTLVISFVGYTTQEVVVSKNKLDITLQENDQVLGETVVIGYGTMARKDVTSSITTIKSKDLNVGVFSDAGSMLQGKVPGLVVTTSGDPNGSPSMTLRGASSLRTGAMSPYYVIDGIPGVDISMVAPDDIESIDVLRDATATAIYGSKAANGVIIITTKKGKKDQERVNVTYSGYVAFDKILNTLDMASAEDIRSYVKENNINYSYDYGSDTNWQDEVLRTAVSHNHNLSINGGSKKTTYAASLNMTNRQGVVKGSGMSRANLRSLVSTKVLKDKLELSVSANAMFGKHTGAGVSDQNTSALDMMNAYNPTAPLYDTDSDGTDWYWFRDKQASVNPVSIINEDTYETSWKRMQFIGKATLNIIDGLTWNANYSYRNNQRTYSYYGSNISQIYVGYNGLATRSTYFGDAKTFETYGNYEKTFADKHKVGVMVGYSWEETNSNDGFGLTVHNFFEDNLKWNNLTYAGKIDGMSSVQSGTKEQIRNISFYGRINYSFNSRYMFQATVRRDGSSVFGDGHQWGTFPSVSLAWNITEEDFMKNQNLFDNLKLRVGYGVSGNAMGFGAYSAVKTYGATGSIFSYGGNDWATLSATKLANADLKWESTGMFNLGLDYGLFKGRLSGSIEFYNKVTKDLIWDYPVSSFIYPFTTISANVGQITNTGIEFSFTAIPVQTKNFTWQSTFNISHNKNTVDKLSNDKYQTSTFSQGDPKIAGVSGDGYTQRVIEGEPLGTFYTYEWAGYNDSGKSCYYVHDENGNRTGETTESPEYKDRTITGCAQPKISLGWNNTLGYKDWSLTAFFTGTFGQDIYDSSRAHYTAPDFFAGGKNVLKEFITDRPYSDTNSNIPSDRFIENGSYLRLQSLSLAYTFKHFNGWLQNIQLYVTMNNVFTITNYKGLDPEVNLGGIDPGVDYRWSSYPHTRTTMIGAKINF